MNKPIYLFGENVKEGNKGLKDLLGGKGANLAEMGNLGIPIPPGFTITTEVCKEYYKNGNQVPSYLAVEVTKSLEWLGKKVGRNFGDTKNPLLVSVRSGAKFSMPGMMDTILNLGLNDKSLPGLIALSKNERFALDTYRRLIQMYSDVVLEVSSDLFEHILEEEKQSKGYKSDADFSVSDLQNIVKQFLRVVKEKTGKDFPQDPREQLDGAILAVFRSWNNPRANTYRRLNKIPDDLGTAVNVQAMVFGNLGNDSATGVFFTRDPSTGENRLLGEYLLNAQGEDVVAGIRTPLPICKASKKGNEKSLEEEMPEVCNKLIKTGEMLEKHMKDMQDIEFTIEQGRLWMLQTRNGKRTARAAVRVAVELVKEKLIDKKEAVLRVAPEQLDQLIHPVFDPKAKQEVMAKGLPASPGAVSGKVVFTADDAEAWGNRGEKVILVRLETSPEDIHGMHSSQGILTGRGGMTSHAAVVARGMGKCCVAGCHEVQIHGEEKYFVTSKGEKFKEGMVISLNGSTGEVLKGEVATVPAEWGEDFQTLMGWVDEFRKLKIRTNADTIPDCESARRFGAEGIGLCRTEHMFFEKSRISAVRQMILANSREKRVESLEKILPMQKEDFKGIFKVMAGYPVTIRLLDPPLHEFLPTAEKEVEELAQTMKISTEELVKRVEELKELNPMLGHRGCRLGITYPEIYEVQVKAIMMAACELESSGTKGVIPEIMIPIVVEEIEFCQLKDMVIRVSEEIKKQFNSNIHYTVGTMIELPRAAILAGDIAKHADFFSFGTNDLTQTTFGLSRDDSSRFLPFYIEKGIFRADPFATIDQKGVGELVRWATEKGRKTKPNLKIGVCGEHGGDPDSIGFFNQLGFDYVSCSPFRVPIARLKAAHLQIQNSEK